MRGTKGGRNRNMYRYLDKWAKERMRENERQTDRQREGERENKRQTETWRERKRKGRERE